MSLTHFIHIAIVNLPPCVTIVPLFAASSSVEKEFCRDDQQSFPENVSLVPPPGLPILSHHSLVDKQRALPYS